MFPSGQVSAAENPKELPKAGRQDAGGSGGGGGEGSLWGMPRYMEERPGELSVVNHQFMTEYRIKVPFGHKRDSSAKSRFLRRTP